MSPRERVQAWLDAARRAVQSQGPTGRRAALVEALAAESALSPEGVRHALDVVLELDRAPAELEAFVAHPLLERAGGVERPAALVLLSANVITAPLRAVAWALAQSRDVRVRASRRASTFARAVVAQAPALISLEVAGDSPRDDLQRLVDALPIGGALHVYGSAPTLDAARHATRARADLDLELHGPGFGVVVATAAELVSHAEAIALDVVAFDQRGCLSPRAAIVVGEAGDAARALHRALSALDVRIPRGPLTVESRAELALAIETTRFAGTPWVGEGHALLDLPEATSLAIGPAARVLPLLHAPELDRAQAWLAPLSSQLTQIACTDALRGPLSAIAPTCALGAMQTPPFDGPADRRLGRRR